MAIEETVKELEKIRIRLTQIYMHDLLNPNNLEADVTLSRDLIKIKKKYNLDE